MTIDNLSSLSKYLDKGYHYCNTYHVQIPNGTAAGTITSMITPIQLIPNTIGKIFYLENHTLITTARLKPFVRVNQNIVPNEFFVIDDYLLNENKAKWLFYPLKENDTMELFVQNLDLTAANIDVYITLYFWINYTRERENHNKKDEVRSWQD